MLVAPGGPRGSHLSAHGKCCRGGCTVRFEGVPGSLELFLSKALHAGRSCLHISAGDKLHPFLPSDSRVPCTSSAVGRSISPNTASSPPGTGRGGRQEEKGFTRLNVLSSLGSSSAPPQVQPGWSAEPASSSPTSSSTPEDAHGSWAETFFPEKGRNQCRVQSLSPCGGAKRKMVLWSVSFVTSAGDEQHK